MKQLQIVRQSVKFYWRTHLGVLAGTALCAMILVGALLVGDSVRHTLRELALLRVGGAEMIVAGGDRFFREQLMADAPSHTVAPVLVARGTVSTPNESHRVNNAQVLGVRPDFWSFAPTPQQGWIDSFASDDSAVGLNERMARQLEVEEGDSIVLWVEKPGLFSKDAPMSGTRDTSIALRLEVAKIVGDEAYGNFSLQGSQVPPSTLFLPMELLQTELEMEGKANLLLVKGGKGEASFEQVESALEKSLQLSDMALNIEEIELANAWEVRTDRVFLDPPVVQSVVDAFRESEYQSVLTYFVNEYETGGRTVPYSMITAVEPGEVAFLPDDMPDNAAYINQWLATHLEAEEGDALSIKYFILSEDQKLVEEQAELTVAGILPMEGLIADSEWMPDFPGLAQSENCREWDTGMPIDLDLIGDEDEKYWDDYRGAPKAYITLSKGQSLWDNRWGNLTSIRFDKDAISREELAQAFIDNLSYDKAGIALVPFRERALSATESPVDFGQLFIAFSIFLIVAAATLTGLLFVFSLEQRNKEAGLLRSLGYGAKQVRRLFLIEGAAIALLGSLLGAALAVVYTVLVLKGLATVWQGAVGSVTFSFHASAGSILGGMVGNLLVAVGAMFWASRHQAKRSSRQLLTGDSLAKDAGAKGRVRKNLLIGAVCVALSIVCAAMAGGSAETVAGAFFGAGAFLLLAGIFLCRAWLRGVSRGGGKEGAPSLASLGLRNTGRRAGRSLATVAVLASGVFMVVAVSSFRKDADTDARDRKAGTGGFSYIGESSMPVYHDLNSQEGQDHFALDSVFMEDVNIVPFRVRAGDDASCLNLNKAVQPRLLAVDPAALSSLDAFAFAEGEGWSALSQRMTDKEWEQAGVVPALVDQNTAMWALKIGVGDSVVYEDEFGAPFEATIVAMTKPGILQGSVIIPEEAFVQKYPSAGGYRFFLIDAPAGEQGEEIREHLSMMLSDIGMQVTPTEERLGEFQAVENTYLSIFQVLGGFGVLLGTVGLAIVVARNMLERRAEFGLMGALGFTRPSLRRLVFVEHRWLILWGLGIGVATAMLAVWPTIQDRANAFPWDWFIGLFAGLAVSCAVWAWLAAALALRSCGVDSLRSE